MDSGTYTQRSIQAKALLHIRDLLKSKIGDPREWKIEYKEVTGDPGTLHPLLKQACENKHKIMAVNLPGLARVFPANFMDIFSNESFTWPFVIGMAVGYPISRWLNRVSGFSTFEHELTHAFVAVLFFKRITRFVVTKNSGGYVEYSGGIQSKTANHLITLAPYYLPLFLFLFVLIRPFPGQKFFPYYDGWLGLWFTFYLMTWYEEIKRNSSTRSFRLAGSGHHSFTDITSEGHVFSFTFIVTFTLLIYNVIFTILENGYRGFHSLFLSVWERSVWFYSNLFFAVEQLIRQ